MDWKKYQNDFPEKLRKAREDAGLTQIELGKRCGLSNQSIWAAETKFTVGKKFYGMRKSNILKIFRILPTLLEDFNENYGLSG